MSETGFQKRECGGGIVLKIFCRVQHGFADFSKSGKVHHSIELVCREKLREAGRIAGVAYNQRNATGQRITVASRKIVQHGDVIIVLEEEANG